MRRWAFNVFQLVKTLLHLVEKSYIVFLLLLLRFLELILIIFGDKVFYFRFIVIILWFQVNLVNTEGTGFSHGGHVLAKSMFRKGRVRVDVGDDWRILLAIRSRQCVRYHVALAFEVADVRSIFAYLGQLVCLTGSLSIRFFSH